MSLIEARTERAQYAVRGEFGASVVIGCKGVPTLRQRSSNAHAARVEQRRANARRANIDPENRSSCHIADRFLGVVGVRTHVAPSPSIGVEELAARSVDSLVRVGAKIVTLRLQHIGWQAGCAVAIVE